MKKYHSTEKGGLWGFFDPKERARKDMDKAHRELESAESTLHSSEEKIKDLMASTPPGNRIWNLMKYQANTEAIELRNSLISVQGIVESLGKMLETDRSHTMTAIDYYENYLEMLGYLQTMHTSFIQRAQGEYYDPLYANVSETPTR